MRGRRRARARDLSVRPTKCRLPSHPAQAQGKRRHLSPDPSRYYNPAVARAERDYSIEDHGAERVLRVDDREYRTYYSARLLEMLIERKGLDRAPLYLPFKTTRGHHFLGPLFRYLSSRGAGSSTSSSGTGSSISGEPKPSAGAIPAAAARTSSAAGRSSSYPQPQWLRRRVATAGLPTRFS